MVLAQHVLEAAGWNVAFWLEIEEIKVLLVVDAWGIYFLAGWKHVRVHVCCEGYDFDDQFGCFFFKRILNK